VGISRSRLVYFFLIACTIIAGLLSREFPNLLPRFLDKYPGDALWALMIYFIVGFIFPRWSFVKVALISILFCYCIELSQLYHAAWIDAIRQTKIGSLILGFGFLWTDVLAYTIGVGLGILGEFIFNKMNSRARMHTDRKSS
jgi:hypothetical protein